jgi:hypothetical protein
MWPTLVDASRGGDATSRASVRLTHRQEVLVWN